MSDDIALRKLSETEEREVSMYGDGVEAGINTVIRDMKRAYLDAADKLTALMEVLRGYGVDLDEGVEA